MLNSTVKRPIYVQAGRCRVLTYIEPPHGALPLDTTAVVPHSICMNGDSIMLVPDLVLYPDSKTMLNALLELPILKQGAHHKITEPKYALWLPSITKELISPQQSEWLCATLAEEISMEVKVQPFTGFSVLEISHLPREVGQQSDSSPLLLKAQQLLPYLAILEQIEKEPAILEHVGVEKEPVCLRDIDNKTSIVRTILRRAFGLEKPGVLSCNQAQISPYLPHIGHFSCAVARSNGLPCSKSRCPVYLIGLSKEKSKTFSCVALFSVPKLLMVHEHKTQTTPYFDISNMSPLIPDTLYKVSGNISIDRKTVTVRRTMSYLPIPLPANNEKLISSYLEILKDLTLSERLNKIVFEMGQHLRIMKREDLISSLLLTAFSVDTIVDPIQHNTINGKINLVVIGDTATGKTSAAIRFIKKLKMGAYFHTDTLSFKQFKAYHCYLTEPNLIVIDEANKWSKNTWAAFRNIRDFALRLIVLANSPKIISEYPQGSVSLTTLFQLPDIRRFDLACFMSVNDLEPGDILNENYSIISDAEITPSMLTSMIAHTRSMNVQFTHDPKPIIEDLINLFFCEGVPLVYPSDFHIKFCKIAAAMAALVGSVSENTILVNEDVGTIVKRLIVHMYNSPACGLGLSSLQARHTRFNAVGYGKSKKALNKIFKWDSATLQQVYQFTGTNYRFKFRDFLKLLQKTEVETARMLHELAHERFLETDGTSYKITDLFRKCLLKIAQDERWT